MSESHNQSTVVVVRVGDVPPVMMAMMDGTIKVADIPAGILTFEIYEKIIAAYLKKGSALTVSEVFPFYENAGPQDPMQEAPAPMEPSDLIIDSTP